MIKLNIRKYLFKNISHIKTQKLYFKKYTTNIDNDNKNKSEMINNIDGNNISKTSDFEYHNLHAWIGIDLTNLNTLTFVLLEYNYDLFVFISIYSISYMIYHLALSLLCKFGKNK